MPKRPIVASIMSLAVTPCASAPFQRMKIVRGTCSQISPVVTTPSISVAPMPNMYAPKAPPVGECESPPTQNIPGLMCPACGTTTWQMPWLSCTCGRCCSAAQSRAMRTIRRASSSASGT